MQAAPVTLVQAIDGRPIAALRSLDGHDELALFGCDYRAALDWLAARLDGGDDRVSQGQFPQLTLGAIDRLFAALYRGFIGPKVEMRQDCGACDKDFELTLALDDLCGDPSGRVAEITLPGGTVLRAPCLADLNRAGQGDDLIALVTLTQGSDGTVACADALATLDPACVETIETRCPHCAAGQQIVFDLPRFLLRCLERERELLLREVHLLARTYRWGLTEILSLRRGDRHAMVRLATAAMAPRDRVQLA